MAAEKLGTNLRDLLSSFHDDLKTCACLTSAFVTEELLEVCDDERLVQGICPICVRAGEYVAFAGDDIIVCEHDP